MEPGWGVSRGADGGKKKKEEKTGRDRKIFFSFGTEPTRKNRNTYKKKKKKTIHVSLQPGDCTNLEPTHLIPSLLITNTHTHTHL